MSHTEHRAVDVRKHTRNQGRVKVRSYTRSQAVTVLSDAEIQAIMGARSPRAISIDLSKRAQSIPEDQARWMRYPGRHDLEGVDTPGVPRPPPRIQEQGDKGDEYVDFLDAYRYERMPEQLKPENRTKQQLTSERKSLEVRLRTLERDLTRGPISPDKRLGIEADIERMKKRRDALEAERMKRQKAPSRAEIWLRHAERPDAERRRDEQTLHSHIVDEQDPKDTRRWMRDPKRGGDVEGIDTPPYGEQRKATRAGTKRKRGEMDPQEKAEITYIARTTNSTFLQARSLRSLALQKGLSYDEVDWDAIQGGDLTLSEKKQKLSRILGSTKGQSYYRAMEHDRDVKAVKKAVKEGREGDVAEIVRGHKKKPEKPQKRPSQPSTVDHRLKTLFQDKHTATASDLSREAAYKHRMGSPGEMRDMIQGAIRSGKLTKNQDGSYSLPKSGSWKAPRQADLSGKKEEQTAFLGSSEGSQKKIRRGGWKDLQEDTRKKQSGRSTDMREFGVEKPNEPSIERFTEE